MKKVFSNSSDVIHTFAQRSQSEGRSSNVFFDGDRIYSYGHHYLLGEFLSDSIIYINDRGYSVTTAKHIGIITSGTRQFDQVFETREFKNVYNDIMSNYAKLGNARKPEIYINEIESLWLQFNHNEKLLNSVNRQTVYKRSKEFKQVSKLVSNLETNFAAELAKSQEIAKNKAIKEAEKIAGQIIKFKTYEIDWLRSSNDYLRISKDGEQVETSQGIKVDTKEAKVLFSMIQSGRDIIGHKIGNYTVISMNGSLKVGCHNITKTEINSFAASQNWI
jgi:hypothetical protein